KARRKRRTEFIDCRESRKFPSCRTRRKGLGSQQMKLHIRSGKPAARSKANCRITHSFAVWMARATDGARIPAAFTRAQLLKLADRTSCSGGKKPGLMRKMALHRSSNGFPLWDAISFAIIGLLVALYFPA